LAVTGGKNLRGKNLFLKIPRNASPSKKKGEWETQPGRPKGLTGQKGGGRQEDSEKKKENAIGEEKKFETSAKGKGSAQKKKEACDR